MTARDLATELAGIRGLVLDVDDTIVDTRAAMTQAGTCAAKALWPDLTDAHRLMAQRYYDDPGRWFHRYAAGEISSQRMRLERLGDVAGAFGVTLPEDALERYLAAYVPAFRRAQRLFDDVLDLLTVAETGGIGVVLLTNSTTPDTTIKLEALGLADRFADLVVTTDTLGFGKPDPRTYLEACRLAEADPSQTVCVGDSIEWDVFGALAAGLRAVWLRRTNAPAARDHRAGKGPTLRASDVPTIGSLAELTAALRTVGAGDLGSRRRMGSISSRFTS